MKNETLREESETKVEEVEESRRRFLKQAGKLAVYAPPAMALMMQPSEASFLRSGAVVDVRERLGEYSDGEWGEKVENFFDQINSYLRRIFGGGDD